MCEVRRSWRLFAHVSRTPWRFFFFGAVQGARGSGVCARNLHGGPSPLLEAIRMGRMIVLLKLGGVREHCGGRFQGGSCFAPLSSSW